MLKDELLTKRDLLKTVIEMYKKMCDVTTKHGINTGFYALKISEDLGFSQEDKDKIIIQGVLHDIGFYLNNKAKEFSELKLVDVENITHCIEGYLRIKNFSPYKTIGLPILHHNEKYNYNKSKTIMGRDIPLNSQIIYIADMIDFLSSDMNNDEIIEYIENNHGSIFNPKLADIAVGLIKEGVTENEDKESYLLGELQYKILSSEEVKESLEFLAYTLDFSSRQTSTHSFDVYYITKWISEKFELSEEDKYLNGLSALTHDVGKLGVDINLIEKKGRLEKEEYQAVMQHVVHTEDMLSHLGKLGMLLQPAYNHHERLNGTGYPRGLKEEDMNINDFILQVSDIFGALIQSRSYKDVFAKDKVINILTEEVEQGKIHGVVVELIVENYDDLLSYVILNRKKHIVMHENINKQRSLLTDKFRKIKTGN